MSDAITELTDFESAVMDTQNASMIIDLPNWQGIKIAIDNSVPHDMIYFTDKDGKVIGCQRIAKP